MSEATANGNLYVAPNFWGRPPETQPWQIAPWILTTVTLAYLAGRIGIGWPTCILLSIFLFHVAHQRIVRHIRTFEVGARSRWRHQAAMESKDGREPAEWFNTLVGGAWREMKGYYGEMIRSSLDASLQLYCPRMLESFGIDFLYLGDTPVEFKRITTRKLRDAQSDDIDETVADVDASIVFKAPDFKAVFAGKVRGLGLPVSFEISECHVEGEVRISFSMADRPPYLRCIKFMFHSDPRVDFVLKPLNTFDALSFDATEIPGISSWLNETIRGLITSTLVRPQALAFSYERHTGPEESEQQRSFGPHAPATGVLVVHVVESQLNSSLFQLASKTLTVSVSLGDMIKFGRPRKHERNTTLTVKEAHAFLMGQNGESLEISLLEMQPFGRSKTLGRKIIPQVEWSTAVDPANSERVYALDCGGTVKVRLLNRDLKDLPAESSLSGGVIPQEAYKGGLLLVDIHDAILALGGGATDVYCRITSNGQREYKSKVAKRTAHPNFSEQIAICVDNIFTSQLVVELRETSKLNNEPLCTGEVKVFNVLTEGRGKHYWLEMDNGNKDQPRHKLCITVQYRPLPDITLLAGDIPAAESSVTATATGGGRSPGISRSGVANQRKGLAEATSKVVAAFGFGSQPCDGSVNSAEFTVTIDELQCREVAEKVSSQDDLHLAIRVNKSVVGKIPIRPGGSMQGESLRFLWKSSGPGIGSQDLTLTFVVCGKRGLKLKRFADATMHTVDTIPGTKSTRGLKLYQMATTRLKSDTVRRVLGRLTVTVEASEFTGAASLPSVEATVPTSLSASTHSLISEDEDTQLEDEGEDGGASFVPFKSLTPEGYSNTELRPLDLRPLKSEGALSISNERPTPASEPPPPTRTRTGSLLLNFGAKRDKDVSVTVLRVDDQDRQGVDGWVKAKCGQHTLLSTELKAGQPITAQARMMVSKRDTLVFSLKDTMGQKRRTLGKAEVRLSDISSETQEISVNLAKGHLYLRVQRVEIAGREADESGDPKWASASVPSLNLFSTISQTSSSQSNATPRIPSPQPSNHIDDSNPLTQLSGGADAPANKSSPSISPLGSRPRGGSAIHRPISLHTFTSAIHPMLATFKHIRSESTSNDTHNSSPLSASETTGRKFPWLPTKQTSSRLALDQQTEITPMDSLHSPIDTDTQGLQGLQSTNLTVSDPESPLSTPPVSPRMAEIRRSGTGELSRATSDPGKEGRRRGHHRQRSQSLAQLSEISAEIEKEIMVTDEDLHGGEMDGLTFNTPQDTNFLAFPPDDPNTFDNTSKFRSESVPASRTQSKESIEPTLSDIENPTTPSEKTPRHNSQDSKPSNLLVAEGNTPETEHENTPAIKGNSGKSSTEEKLPKNPSMTSLSFFHNILSGLSLADKPEKPAEANSRNSAIPSAQSSACVPVTGGQSGESISDSPTSSTDWLGRRKKSKNMTSLTTVLPEAPTEQSPPSPQKPFLAQTQAETVTDNPMREVEISAPTPLNVEEECGTHCGISGGMSVLVEVSRAKLIGLSGLERDSLVRENETVAKEGEKETNTPVQFVFDEALLDATGRNEEESDTNADGILRDSLDVIEKGHDMDGASLGKKARKEFKKFYDTLRRTPKHRDSKTSTVDESDRLSVKSASAIMTRKSSLGAVSVGAPETPLSPLHKETNTNTSTNTNTTHGVLSPGNSSSGASMGGSPTSIRSLKIGSSSTLSLAKLGGAIGKALRSGSKDY